MSRECLHYGRDIKNQKKQTRRGRGLQETELPTNFISLTDKVLHPLHKNSEQFWTTGKGAFDVVIAKIINSRDLLKDNVREISQRNEKTKVGNK